MSKTAPAPGRADRRRARAGKLAFLGPGLAYVTVFMAVPILLITIYSFLTRGRFGGVQWTFDLSSWAQLADPVYLSVIGNSLLIAGATTLLALLLGYPTAYAITRLPGRWRAFALVLVVLPFWTNFLVRTYTWIILLNTQGPINGVLQALHIVDAPIDLLYNRGAVIAGLLYAYLPLMILPLYAALDRQDPSLTEAAINLGAPRWRVFRDITLPLSAPGAMIGAIFVFVPSLGNFIIPELLGGKKTIMIGNLIRDQFLSARDWPFGSALAVLMVIVLVVLFAIQAAVSRRITGRNRHA